MVRATIYAPKGSYAIEYAKKNDISYVMLDENNTGIGSDDDEIASEVTGITNAKVSGIKESYVYSGKAWNPAVTVELDGKTLKKDTDYTVAYINNIKTGKATVIIKGIHSYHGTIEKTFYIVPKKATISKLTSPRAKQIRVTWKKDPQATGYQIQYARNSKFTGGKKSITIAKKSAISKKISKLAKNKKYYVRIRAYKKIDGAKWYGSWSKTKKVKCRK